MAKTDVKVLKGQEAEDKVLEYFTRMNRPYGAVDVTANLKGAVPKSVMPKILLALAEKGLLVQKVYGKTSFFVANQANIDSIPAEKISSLEAENTTIQDENKLLAAEIKALSSELSKLKASPTNAELDYRVAEVTETITKTSALLQPLRSGAPLISEVDLEQVNANWTKWRAEWLRRKKIFLTFWQMVTDTLTPQEAETLAEDLAIEHDTPEHISVERGPLGIPQRAINPLKRKR